MTAYDAERNRRLGDLLEELHDMYNSARGRIDRLSQNGWASKVMGVNPATISNWKTRSLPEYDALITLANVVRSEYNAEKYKKLTARHQELAQRYSEAGLDAAYMARRGVGDWAYHTIFRIVGKPEPIPDDPRIQTFIAAYEGANPEARKVIWMRFQQALDDLQNMPAAQDQAITNNPK